LGKCTDIVLKVFMEHCVGILGVCFGCILDTIGSVMVGCMDICIRVLFLCGVNVYILVMLIWLIKK